MVVRPCRLLLLLRAAVQGVVIERRGRKGLVAVVKAGLACQCCSLQRGRRLHGDSTLRICVFILLTLFTCLVAGVQSLALAALCRCCCRTSCCSGLCTTDEPRFQVRLDTVKHLLSRRTRDDTKIR